MPVVSKKRKKSGRIPSTEKALLQYLNEGLSNDFPNPKRIGCPPLKALQRNARDSTRANETVSRHVGQCSPCYRVYSPLLRKEIARMRRESSDRTPTSEKNSTSPK